MKVLFATGEAFPFVKTGGLGDVSYSLPKALVQKENVDVRVILPKYSKISSELLKNARHLGHKEIWVAHHNEYVGIEEVKLEGIIYYLVDNERYFKRLNVYGEFDDCERFLFFSKAVVETMDITNFKPDIIHCNDWQSALIPIYLKERGIYDVKTIFTIHNLRFQGFFFNNVIEDLLEIDRAKYFQEDGLKYYDMISFLKGGVVYSDYITTVSDSYAEEIKTPELGEGIHGLFQKYDYKLLGIVNGIDKSSYLLSKKSHKTLKADLQKKLGLNVEEKTPLVAIITRLDRQKGLDYIVEKFDEMMSLGIQFVLLGTGEKRYEHFFAYQEYLNKGKVCSYIGFNQELSSEIYAGADIFLMPSVFEPCGLSQMIAMRYGCIPVVRETGGLKDTVKPYNEYTGEGDGFGFKQANADDMIKTLRYAIKMYHRPNVWQEIIKNAKKRDNSWDKPAKRYKELYQRLIEG
ncbi:glycogen synthase [Fusobacterium canifelinum]|uniref:Glycogen synthase n=1 Tax=Fusobacterium canifelinum TaxID=285729 RepID=A0A3P1V633_9FUSO|nr:glycogen/starch synthase [Fusobacterium canifelinum]RRD28785.1 glycogen synthase [Fusobacterium canifelinum]